jgi:hypothetical protein
MSTLSNALTATKALTGATPRELLFQGIDAGARALGAQPAQPLRSSRDVLGLLGADPSNPLVGALAGAADVALDPRTLASPAPGVALAGGALKGAAQTIPELSDLVTAQESLGKYLQAYKGRGEGPDPAAGLRDSGALPPGEPPAPPVAEPPAAAGPTPPVTEPATQPGPPQLWTPATTQTPKQLWTPIGPGGIDPITAAALGINPVARY